MPRKPSSILNVKESKAVDLDKQIDQLNRELVKAQKVVDKLTKDRDKLVVRRDKALAKKAPKIDGTEVWLNGGEEAK